MFQVFSPTTPSASRPLADWNAFTAAVVAGPYLPSTVRLGRDESNWARVFSQNCTCCTAAPVLPSRSTVPPQAPPFTSPSMVSPSLVSSARSLTLT